MENTLAQILDALNDAIGAANLLRQNLSKAEARIGKLENQLRNNNLEPETTEK